MLVVVSIFFFFTIFRFSYFVLEKRFFLKDPKTNVDPLPPLPSPTFVFPHTEANECSFLL